MEREVVSVWKRSIIHACNEEKFESSLLKAGEEYHTTTVYAFSTK